MQCPRCHVEINVLPDPGGVILCPGCGVRLMTRSVPVRAGSESPSAPASALPAGAVPASNPGLDPAHPSSTLPPGTPLKKVRRPGEDTARAAYKAPPPTADLETPASGMAPISRSHAGSNGHASLDQVLAEVQAVRETQQIILSLLLGRPADEVVEEPVQGDSQPGFLAPVRTRRRKSVLLIDDDPATRDAAVAEMEQAQVLVRAVADGNAGIQSIAAEKPDVIALELDISGGMAGKDVINMIKATMEWVDIPILLYTRVPLESQKEARTVHGADDLVLKRSGPAALVSRVITIFRRGA
jgi:CheY-like chemotaxis protein